MFDCKFISTLIALVVAVLAICNLNSNKTNSREGFGFGGLPSMTWKKDRVMASSQEAAAKGDFYSVPGTYQSILNPRFSNLQYGANINYKMPSYKHQAVPYEPLAFGNMAKEDFCCNGAGCSGSKNGNEGPNSYQADPVMSAGYAAGNYNDTVNKAFNDNNYPDATDMVPVGDMTTVNALGETVTPVVYDRFIYANRNSRLRSLGDPIRGDLPIVPCSSDWFRPSVHPSIDLQEGAMNVIGGVDNSTTQALAELIHATSGDTTVAGTNGSTMKNTMTGQSMSTINVTAFP